MTSQSKLNNLSKKRLDYVLMKDCLLLHLSRKKKPFFEIKNI